MQLNEGIFAGYLGQDAKVFGEGSVVALSIAYSHNNLDKDGRAIKQTTWIPVKVFGAWAKTAARYKKGDNIVAKGILTENKWTDKETGKERTTLEVRAFSVGRVERDEKPAATADGFSNEQELPF